MSLYVCINLIHVCACVFNNVMGSDVASLGGE